MSNDVQLQPMGPDHAEDISAFAASIPEHDLLFLPRDITRFGVVDAWLDEIVAGAITTKLAFKDDRIVGMAAVVSDDLSWSLHVGDIRVLVAADERHHGLGRMLVEEALAMARAREFTKVTAHMTADQTDAARMFIDLGFEQEALLRRHVRGRDGQEHNLIVLSQFL